MKFTKSDLKTGHIITLRNRREYMVLRNPGFSNSNYVNDLIVDINKESHSWEILIGYDNELNNKLKKEYDIMKVEVVKYPSHIINGNHDERTLVWERTEHKEMTVAEIEKILGYPIKIVKENN